MSPMRKIPKLKTRPQQVYVVAVNFDQAKTWADENGLCGLDWRYVHQIEDLMGVHHARVEFVGSWYLRGDAPALEMMAERARQ